MRVFLFLLLSGLFFCDAAAQEAPVGNIVDDIQVDVKSVSMSGSGDTLKVELFLISYQRGTREFKLNTFATQLVDTAAQKHLYSAITMGRVHIRLEERRNYLHYLLEEDVPVPLHIAVGDWQGRVPKSILLVFEDSKEEGKFTTQEVDLQASFSQSE
ncbi:hypothetical protein BC792_1366 [Sphingobacterium allocomposti]|uniref:Uncharacterized protein n=1 Tax=Sphingobacterium allocomposti TaxID=415956 RepID=A0A5S5CYG0_9SPHI|nr:hypothetical protein [Sphingobacterium composti Yoo et al. 2007 non Ten et al. 2007]TYP87399.1 hypothetical protein BC792_1366 [Sphingobacterium composti Yoo et al. 2007 non Ten et al. 2007]